MLRKLLKYDMRSVFGIWWIMAIGVGSLSVVGAMAWRFLNATSDYDFSMLKVIAGLVVFGSIVAIIASAIVTPVLTYMRYYNHFFTDEGYLTFTLPVSRKMHYLSKTINALIWTTANAILIILCIFIFMLIAPVPRTGGLLTFDGFIWLGEAIAFLWKSVGAWLIVYVIEALILYAVSTVFAAGLIHFCITVASIVVKKAKIVAAVGIYYAINMVLSTVSQLFMIFGLGIVTNGISQLLYRAPEAVHNLTATLILLIVALIIAAAACLINFATLGLVERKLNLA